VGRLSGLVGNEVGAEVGSDRWAASQAREAPYDPTAATIVLEDRDRPARFGTEQLKAALSAERCPAEVVDPCEGEDDLVGDVTEVLTSSCVALAGRRGARNRAESALRCARNDLGQMALRRDGAVARPGVRHQL
jgi:putative resolvase